MKKYNFPAGTQMTRSMFARNVSDHVNYHALGAGAATKITLPAGAKYVEVKSDQPLYARFGSNAVTAAAVPTANVTDGSSALPVASGEVLVIPAEATHVSVISEAAAKVSLAYFS